MEYIESDVSAKHSLRVGRTFLSSRLAEEVQKKAYAYLVPSGELLACKDLLKEKKKSIINLC